MLMVERGLSESPLSFIFPFDTLELMKNHRPPREQGDILLIFDILKQESVVTSYSFMVHVRNISMSHTEVVGRSNLPPSWTWYMN